MLHNLDEACHLPLNLLICIKITNFSIIIYDTIVTLRELLYYAGKIDKKRQYNLFCDCRFFGGGGIFCDFGGIIDVFGGISYDFGGIIKLFGGIFTTKKDKA